MVFINFLGISNVAFIQGQHLFEGGVYFEIMFWKSLTTFNRL